METTNEKREAAERKLALIETKAPGESDQRVGLLIRQTPLAFIVWDLDFRVIEWNPAAEKIFGWPEAEAIGQHASFIVPESDREHVDEVFGALLTQSGGARSTNRNVTKDGRTIHTEWYNAPLLDDAGQVICVASLCQDVTARVEAERKLTESEERLRLVVEGCEIGTWDWDIGSDLVTWNERTQHLLGVDAPSGPAATLRHDLVHPEERDTLKLEVDRSIEEDRSFTFDARVLSETGYRWCVISGKALRDQSGKPFRIVGTVIDIHERKCAELQQIELAQDLDKRIRDRQRELDLARDELEEMCYAVSHDLRAPLRHIHGYSRSVEQDSSAVLDEQALGYLQRIQAATKNLGDLLDGLLSMVRVNRVEAVSEEVDLSALARSIADEFRTSHPDHAVHLEIEEGMTAKGDPRLLRLLLVNLLSNAWKFTADEPDPRVVFSREDGRTYMVRDNGMGFDMRYSDKLYKPFQKVHSSNRFPGTGIGLAIAHRIVSRHGGTIWAEGREGEGATFYFTLGG